MGEARLRAVSVETGTGCTVGVPRKIYDNNTGGNLLHRCSVTWEVRGTKMGPEEGVALSCGSGAPSLSCGSVETSDLLRAVWFGTVKEAKCVPLKIQSERYHV
jgi:hypothetical protein